MAKMRARFQGSQRHEESKNIDRIRKRVKKAFHSEVAVFKELINSGPYYICVVCNGIGDQFAHLKEISSVLFLTKCSAV